MVEQSGKVWIGGDDPSSATSAMVTITTDDRVVVQVGGQVVANWPVAQVTMAEDGDTTEFRVGNDRLMFEADSPDSWRETMSAVQMRIRLGSGSKSSPADVLNPQPSDSVPMAATTFCHACGRQIDPRAEVCVYCGVRQRRAYSRNPKDRTTAAVLALFLGGIGVHRFYLGQLLLGFIYLFFSWTFVPAIIALVDAIILFRLSDEEFDAKFNRD